jgi:hypothetical protein
MQPQNLSKLSISATLQQYQQPQSDLYHLAQSGPELQSLNGVSTDDSLYIKSERKRTVEVSNSSFHQTRQFSIRGFCSLNKRKKL